MATTGSSATQISPHSARLSIQTAERRTLPVHQRPERADLPWLLQIDILSTSGKERSRRQMFEDMPAMCSGRKKNEAGQASVPELPHTREEAPVPPQLFPVHGLMKKRYFTASRFGMFPCDRRRLMPHQIELMLSRLGAFASPKAEGKGKRTK